MPRESGASSNPGFSIDRKIGVYWIIRFRG
jgi:hypothetical protein